MKRSVLLILLLFVSTAQAEGEDCKHNEGLPDAVTSLTKDLGKISNGLFKDVAKVKVEYDGEGKLSIYYENGEPKILKFTYQNKTGPVVIQKTFEELNQGKKISYENNEKPGQAMILERGPVFQKGSYSFKLSLRSKLKPERYTSYPIELKGDHTNPQLVTNKKLCKNIIISPGVTFRLSWDGTFQKADFK